MKKTLSLLAFLLVLCTCVRAQETFNTTLRDSLGYTDRLNDVWGYVAPDGTEYALVGLRSSVSIVSLADPDNLVEVANVPGDFSIWRDIKTYGDYAYVVADQRGSDEGILVIDLSGLPTGVTAQRYNTGNTPGADLLKAHNIYIDTLAGLAYVAGGNVNGGGMVIYDVATTPGVPTFVAYAPSVYAHDVFVVNDVMYASEIYEGRMTLYDVADPANITFMGTIQTPSAFTHNVWATPDGQVAFTTDERGNAPTAAYDVSDPNDITLLDEFRPRRSLGTGTVPHNVHVKDDYLIISHYTDGVEIVDASVPDNMIEVAYFDSYTGPDGGSNGSWGAYPYLPSGLVLLTDINNGLYVFDVNYQRAARLLGEVTDRDTGLPLNNVTVTIADSDGVVAGTNALGDFKTGLATAGTYEVTFSLPDYEDLTVTVELQNGVELVLDTFLIQTALPVTLADFTAAPRGKVVSLAWTTAQEEGSSLFVVERSQNGIDFTEIGRVAAAGTSFTEQAYAFDDLDPLTGTSYYRLRSVDLDGSFSLSELRQVNFQGESKLSVYPNPVGNQLRLSAEVNGPVRVYRSDGVLIREITASGREIEVGQLPVGQYWLRVGREALPFVKR